MITATQSIVIADKENGSSIKLDFLHLKKASLVLRALNHKLRQQMIKLLDESKK